MRMGDNQTPVWAGKVARAKIARLYMTDAQGIVDAELIDEVGWALWSRCDSILAVTEAHHGRVRCPACADTITRQEPRDESEVVCCAGCGWQLPWADYHQTYKGKQLFGANAVDAFAAFHLAFPLARGASAKMLLIDQLINAFHQGLTEIGRPAAANLIQGTLKEVIQFLDGLSFGDSAAGLAAPRAAWRKTLSSASWAHYFLKPDSTE
jgi:predicted RNA-binding Zn-ribbon protein involved in translation (DUF1610 family)